MGQLSMITSGAVKSKWIFITEAGHANGNRNKDGKQSVGVKKEGKMAQGSEARATAAGHNEDGEDLFEIRAA